MTGGQQRHSDQIKWGAILQLKYKIIKKSYFDQNHQSGQRCHVAG